MLFPRHFKDDASRDKTINLIHTFRDYLHYHIKCSKVCTRRREVGGGVRVGRGVERFEIRGLGRGGWREKVRGRYWRIGWSRELGERRWQIATGEGE